MAEAPTRTQASLREEHDDLARRLEIRPSVDVARDGFVAAFAGILATGIASALAWGRHEGLSAGAHPDLSVVGAMAAGAVGVVLVVRAALALRRSRRMARDEAALFGRLLELRRILEIDA